MKHIKVKENVVLQGVNELTTLKSRDTGVMNLVKHVNVTLPYLVDYYQIPVCA